MNKSIIVVLSLILILLFLSGCSSTPPQQTSSANQPVEKKEAVLYTGKPCFTRMVDQARRWSLDAMPVHVESELNSESIGHDGKATVWQATFVSPSRGTARVYSCSGSILADEPPAGISARPEMTASTAVPMFDPSFLGIDSDAAYAMAQEKGGAKLMEKDPKQPVIYALNWDPQKKQLVWIVVYGTDPKDSKGVGVIDASTGKFLRASK